MKIKALFITASFLVIASFTLAFAEGNPLFTATPIKVMEAGELTNEMVLDIIHEDKPVLLKGAARNWPLAQMTPEELKEKLGDLIVGYRAFMVHGKNEYLDKEKQSELIEELKKVDIPCGNLYFPGGDITEPASEAECTTLKHALDALELFEGNNTNVEFRFQPIEEKNRSLVQGFPDILPTREHDGYGVFGHFLDRAETYFSSPGAIGVLHTHGDAFLAEIMGKKLALLVSDDYHGDPFTITPKDSFGTYDKHFDRLNICNLIQSTIMEVNEEGCPVFHSKNINYCCIRHKTLRDKILNSVGDSIEIDNSDVQARHLFGCNPMEIHYAVLEKGDILYIPEYWSHELDYLKTSLGFSHIESPRECLASDQTQN